MTRHDSTRRLFLKRAGAAALLGATGAAPATPTAASSNPRPPVRNDYDFDEIYDRVGTESVRWDRAIEEYGDGIVAGMGVADMDFRAAPCITNALAERCIHENWGYMHRPDSYASAVSAWNRRRYGLDIDPAHIVFTTGVHPGIIAALHAFSPPGTPVLITTPTYDGFYTDIKFSRTVADECRMIVDAEGRWSIDFDDFERRAKRCNSFILCNPQNPTGNCWSADDLMRMGEICLRHRVVVLADEIHCDFVTAGNRYIPFASLPDRDIVRNSITYKSASKSFSLAAMKVAWYHSTNAELLERASARNRADLSTLGMIATRAALNEGEPWLDELIGYLDVNHDLVESRIDAEMPGVRHRKGQGTYLAWLDVGELSDRIGADRTAAREREAGDETVTPEKIVQRWFAEHAGVFLNPGPNYGPGGSGYMRMNLASPRAVVDMALTRMSEAIAAL